MNESVINPASRVTAVIPSLDPDGKLISVIKELRALGFDDIIVVDDGSRTGLAYFDEAHSLGCEVLRHGECRGKGTALKTGFARYLDAHPGRTGIVTLDADGQHRPPDAARCAALLCENESSVILGTRNLSDKCIPPRSRLGSRITALLLLLFCGMRSSDPQTGLRGIPHALAPALCRVRGTRYEYEPNVLLECKNMNVSFVEFPINADYSDTDRVSHFRSVRDSLRVNALFLTFMLSSMSSYAVDIIAFYLLSLLLLPVFGDFSAPVSTVIARVISATVNYLINRKTVFHSAENVRRSTVRFFCSSAFIMAMSAGSVWLLSLLLGASAAILQTLIKMCVDTFLFFINFRLQREWVFKTRHPDSAVRSAKN